MADESGYIVVGLPLPYSMTLRDVLWTRLVDDVTAELTPLLELSKYLDKVELTISDTGVSLDFIDLNDSLAGAGGDGLDVNLSLTLSALPMSEAAPSSLRYALHLNRDGMATTTQRQDSLMPTHTRAQRASVPAGLRARGRGVCGAARDGHQHHGWRTSSIAAGLATANRHSHPTRRREMFAYGGRTARFTTVI